MSCSVPGCSGDDYSSGLCSRHYNRLRVTGTVSDGPRARASFEDRFWRHVDRRDPDECWHWTAKGRVTGYGYLAVGGRGSKKVLSHRAAWIIANGPIPDGDGYHGLVVMHTCDNRLCCNPAHLRLGTQAENVTDMDVKNRRKTVAKSGSEHHNARFTEADIKHMRSSGITAVELARIYNTHRNVIYNILNGRTWRHIL